MNAALDTGRLNLRAEIESLRDRLNVAIQQRDRSKRDPAECQFWNERIQSLEAEMRLCRNRLGIMVIPGDGGPDEQRRLEAREDAKREYDSYA